MKQFVALPEVTVDVERLPPRIPHALELCELEIMNDDDEKLAAEGLEANANRAVAATCRMR